MHATPTTDPLDVATFAGPTQQRRYSAAMWKIKAEREPGAPVRVYISAGPKVMERPQWDGWREQITGALPEGVEVLDYRNVFGDDRPYDPNDWKQLVSTLDGLIVVGKQKRAGSRVYLLGPVARLELRSLIAHKPVLLWGHHQGLIPVIDCKSQVMTRPDAAPRLKLIAPKRWKRDADTLQAAIGALTPGPAQGGEPVTAVDRPFTGPTR
ncbi:hypothetical protein ACTWJ8_40320 (plasmid) [Streptomyces sp. SDT5-1]|uniref:hypothetical protein n=1 Tax=Streptomyces sp. SDT5-1 TaxID=3406418 RepID=UPI003FD4D64E